MPAIRVRQPISSPIKWREPVSFAPEEERMALRSVPAARVSRRSNVVANRQSLTLEAEASPGEWMASSEHGTDEVPSAWRRVSGLTASEAMDLLAWLETSQYVRRQISYGTGEGFSVRFQ